MCDDRNTNGRSLDVGLWLSFVSLSSFTRYNSRPRKTSNARGLVVEFPSRRSEVRLSFIGSAPMCRRLSSKLNSVVTKSKSSRCEQPTYIRSYYAGPIGDQQLWPNTQPKDYPISLAPRAQLSAVVSTRLRPHLDIDVAMGAIVSTRNSSCRRVIAA